MENGLVRAALQDLEIPDLDFGAFIRKSWIRHGEKTAVVDDATGTSCTYVELERQCWSVAAGMHSLGFVPGDVAAFTSANSLDLVVAVFGAIFAGGKVTFVKTNLTEREVEDQLSKVSPRMLFADTQNAGKVAAATKKLTSVKNSMLLLYPTYIRYLIEAPIPEKLDLSGVRAILIGGSTTPVMYLKKLSKIFPRANVVCGYGLTEVSAAAVYCRRPCDDASCLGPPVPFLEVKVVDVTTNKVLGPQECGEICIRGPTVFKAYLNMSEATAKAFDEEGFFRTGDTGYYTADGHFHVAGRIKDLIKCMDQQVAPAELETLLLSHPDVREVVVAGVPHSEHGEAARAFVVLRKGCQGDEDMQENLKTFVKDLVAYHKQLHGGIEFLDQLPATETGKALRRELRDAYLKRIAATASS
ncbi:hypothetical protein MTO96_019988 [Rhipicephalus appendiculatus]